VILRLLYLWLAVALFGLSNAVVVFLNERGGSIPGVSSNPFSFWALLALANLAMVVSGTVRFQRHWRSAILRKIRGGDWMAMLVLASLSGIVAPALFVLALSKTSLINVVLVARLEPAVTLLLVAFVVGIEAGPLRVCGAFTVFAGVVLTIFLQGPAGGMAQPGALSVGPGEMMAVTAAVAVAIATAFYKLWLPHVPPATYAVVRSLLAAIVFGAILLSGRSGGSLRELSSPEVAPWLVGYAVAFGAVAPLLWLHALALVRPVALALATAATPVLAIVAARYVLGVTPTIAQALGAAVVGIGLLMTIVGVWSEYDPDAASTIGAADEIDCGVGFKGI